MIQHLNSYAKKEQEYITFLLAKNIKDHVRNTKLCKRQSTPTMRNRLKHVIPFHQGLHFIFIFCLNFDCNIII